MRLNFWGHFDERWVILHETGHILGFTHEHQHYRDIINKEKFFEDIMKTTSPQQCDADKAEAYYKIVFASCGSIMPKSTYDKDSIMAIW